MSDAKRQATAFNPKSTALRRKLWVRMQTPDGPRIFFIWSRIFKLLAVLLVLGWLGSATALWAFVRYHRGVSNVSFVDIAFLPLRRDEYRATLGRHHFATAKEQLSQQRWGEAIFNLRAAVARTPANLEARRILAAIYQQSNQPEPAMKLLEDGLMYAPKDPAYLRETFGLLQRQPERVLRQSARLLPAEPDRDPAHLFITWQTAAALHALQRDDESLALIKRWQIDRNPEGRQLIAAIAAAGGRHEEAENIYRQQLREDPKNEAAALQLTRLLIRQGRTEEARRAALLRTLALPDSPGAAIDLLNLTWQTGDKESYHRDANTYLQKHKADERALQMLASLAAKLTQPELAATVLATAAAQGHAEAQFRLSLLEAQCAAADFAAAVATAEILTGLEPLPPRFASAANFLKAWAYLGRQRPADAEPWLQRGLLQPRLEPAQLQLFAAAYEKLNAIPAAGRVLAAAAALAPDQAGPLLALVEFHARHEQWTAAEALLPRLLAFPEPPQALVATIREKSAEENARRQALAVARAEEQARIAEAVRAEAAASAEAAALMAGQVRAELAAEAARIAEAARAAAEAREAADRPPAP
ncbi:MAG: tetratricopeptide repeat protein [Opitutaceae bacterium]|nr:tetratricopeptide repeat protein [Opitutaceae bacterium]